MEGDILVVLLSSGTAAAIVSGISSIVIWILNNRKNKTNRHDDIVEGLQVLLYDRIKYLGLKYIEAGEITATDLEDLKRIHKVYHDKLNGNGYLDNIMCRVEKLPIKND